MYEAARADSMSSSSTAKRTSNSPVEPQEANDLTHSFNRSGLPRVGSRIEQIMPFPLGSTVGLRRGSTSSLSPCNTLVFQEALSNHSQHNSCPQGESQLLSI